MARTEIYRTFHDSICSCLHLTDTVALPKVRDNCMDSSLTLEGRLHLEETEKSLLGIAIELRDIRSEEFAFSLTEFEDYSTKQLHEKIDEYEATILELSSQVLKLQRTKEVAYTLTKGDIINVEQLVATTPKDTLVHASVADKVGIL